MTFSENEFDDIENEIYGGAMQEICTQLRDLQLKVWDYRLIKERVYELEMRAGMHSTDYRQIDLF